jgi:hypothetical protein
MEMGNNRVTDHCRARLAILGILGSSIRLAKLDGTVCIP